MPLEGGQGGQGWQFGSSVNPIATRGADYVHHITASPPGFENSVASLIWIIVSLKFKVRMYQIKPNEWYSYLTEKKDVNSGLAY